jgi:hypothetical protein
MFGDAVFGPGGCDRLPEIRKAQVQGHSSNINAELLGSGFMPLWKNILKAGWVHMMATGFAGARINAQLPCRKQILPAELSGSLTIFSG